MTVLVFLEFPEQIDPALAALADENDYGLVALTPHVEFELELRGIKRVCVSSLVPEANQEALGFQNFGVVERLCATIDEFWQKRFPYFQGHDLRPAWLNFFALKVLYDSVTTRLSEMLRILDDVKPERVFFFETHRAPFDEKLYWERESVYTHVISLSCRLRNIPVEVLSEGNFSRCRTLGLSTWVYLRARLLQTGAGQVLRVLRGVGLRCMLRLWLGRSRRVASDKRILFWRLDYNLSYIATVLVEGNDADIWVWGDGHPHPLGRPWRTATTEPDLSRFSSEQERHEAWNVLCQHPDFRSSFHFEGVDWFGLVAERLQYLCEVTFGKMERDAASARALLAAARPRLFVFSSISDQQCKTLAQVARKSKIPVVVSPHGEMGTHLLPVNFYNDYVSADYCLAYGAGFVTALERHYPGRMVCSPVGSSRLDGLLAGAPSRMQLCRRYGLDPVRKVVVYVLGALDGNFGYRSFRQPEDRVYFGIQKRLVDEFSRHPTVQFVLKLHSNPDHPRSPIGEVIRRDGITNCRIIDDAPFGRLLKLADLFIIDSASTALLEMLITDTPVYIFNDWFRWEPEALEALKRRAYVADDLETFCATLTDDLRTGRAFERRLTDRTFLKLYGLPYPGETSRRAADALLSLVNHADAIESRPKPVGEVCS